MTQTIEQLTARIAELETQLAANNPLLDEAANRIDELEEENARLNSEIEMLKSGKRSNIRLGMEIAASQAYAEQLREALETLNKVSDIGCDRVEKALALPRDTSALDAYIAEKVKEAMK